MHLVREAIAEKRVTVKHVQTLEMIADRLTKTLDGADFDFFTNNVLGANKSISGHWGYETKPELIVISGLIEDGFNWGKIYRLSRDLWNKIRIKSEVKIYAENMIES
jgi:hypothetical protein